MRTTVDLPPAIHARARQIAAERRMSLSSVIADLAARGLAASGESLRLGRSARTGLPTVLIGSSISTADVADALDEE